MRVVHVTYPTAHVRRAGGRLEIYVRNEKREEIRLHGLRQLVLTGSVAVSPPAMDLLLTKGIDTVFLTGSGRFRGRLSGHLSSNIQLRLRQFERLKDPSFALKLAKTIVIGKIRNQRQHLLRHRRRHGLDELSTAIVALRAASLRTEFATSLDEVRGCEGSASAAYFRVFQHLLRHEDFTFHGRTRRPPLDPVNALLSLGYTLLFNLVHSTVERVGLDPYLGALHAPMTGRPSLVCDLVEEFRALVVDALVVGAINRRLFRLEDFEDAGPGEPVIVKRETMRWMVQLFERRVEQPARYPPLGSRLPLHRIVEQQARGLARHLAEDAVYHPYHPSPSGQERS